MTATPSDLGRALVAQRWALRRPNSRACNRCGTLFETLGRGRYCSPHCKNQARKVRAQGERH